MSTLGYRHPSTTTAPANWKPMKFRYLANERDFRVGLRSRDHTLLSLTLEGIKPRNLEEGGKNPESYETYKEVVSGDLVFCQFDYDVTPRTVGVANQRGMVTGAYTIFSPEKWVDIRFLYYMPFINL